MSGGGLIVPAGTLPRCQCGAAPSWEFEQVSVTYRPLGDWRPRERTRLICTACGGDVKETAVRAQEGGE